MITTLFDAPPRPTGRRGRMRSPAGGLVQRGRRRFSEDGAVVLSVKGMARWTLRWRFGVQGEAHEHEDRAPWPNLLLLRG